MLEIADIIRQTGGAYQRDHEEKVLPSHRRVLHDLVACRTPQMGGHVRECDQCGEVRYSYHSCGNRHCPKCQGARTEKWLDNHRERLLECPYFFLTFTLPKELRGLAYAHQRLVYGILMKAAAESILQLARDPKFVGGVPGLLGVLHTWTRDLRYHPHVHFLVTGGGIADGGHTWRKPRHSGFLMPGRVLSVLFRGKFRDALDKADLLESTHRRAWRSRWVVHAQSAGAGHEVLEYLARYVHRVALPNSRLEAFDGESATFRYRDGRTQKLVRCTLPAEDFLERFLQHVLPQRFIKVRKYGLFASTRRKDFDAARDLLEQEKAAENPVTPAIPCDAPEEVPDEVGDADQDPPCPRCKTGLLRLVAEIPRPRKSRSGWARAPPDAVPN